MTKPTTLRQRRRVVALFATTALALSACGSSAPASDRASLSTAGAVGRATTIPTTATTTTTTAATTTTTITATTTAPPTTAAPTTAAPTTAEAPTTTQPRCGSNLASSLASTGQATQLVTVSAATDATTSATLTLWRRHGSCWVAAAGPWTAVIGNAGFSDHHREGDDTTPTGAYGIGPVMFGNAPNPGVRYPYHQLVCGDWWDEDPSSPDYNSFQHVPCGQQPPFGGGSEPLWQETVAYPSFALIDYNTSPVVPGAGSAIFIHANIGIPTDGCVSLPLGELDQLLDWLDPAADPLIVLGPAGEITSF